MIEEGKVKMKEDNRMKKIIRRIMRKLKRKEKIVGVSEWDGRRLVGKRMFDDIEKRKWELKKGIGGMKKKMKEKRSRRDKDRWV